MDKSKVLEAGKIARQVREEARNFIKKGMPLIEIADKIEERIIELKGKPAFPVNLSIDETAAHFTPLHNDETLARGLLKVDIGVHIDGWVADTAFSMDLENSEENKKIIMASEKALENAIKTLKENVKISEIGKNISETIESYNLAPIVNLGGHGLEEYEAHAEPFIPNIEKSDETKLKKGLYAIEPFATNGNGKVHDGEPHGIYILTSSRNIRSPLAREILRFIEEEYQNLPFCSRWIVKKFGKRALFGLNQLEQNENIHHFPQLIESSKGLVSQAEHTILIESTGIIVTTK